MATLVCFQLSFMLCIEDSCFVSKPAVENLLQSRFIESMLNGAFFVNVLMLCFTALLK